MRRPAFLRRAPEPEQLNDGLYYIDPADQNARMRDHLNDLHGRVTRLEQQIHDMRDAAGVEPTAPARRWRLLGGAR